MVYSSGEDDSGDDGQGNIVEHSTNVTDSLRQFVVPDGMSESEASAMWDGISVDEQTSVVEEKPPTATEDGHVSFQKSHVISYHVPHPGTPDGVWVRRRVRHPVERLVLSATGMRVDTAGTLSYNAAVLAVAP